MAEIIQLTPEERVEQQADTIVMDAILKLLDLGITIREVQQALERQSDTAYLSGIISGLKALERSLDADE